MPRPRGLPPPTAGPGTSFEGSGADEPPGGCQRSLHDYRRHDTDNVTPPLPQQKANLPLH